MVDAAYEELYRAMKPGMRENECVALVSKVLFELGSEHVEGVNAISGERCSPHPHVFTDRMLRPGDPAYFDILHAYNGYRTCYYRTFAVGSASPAHRRRLQALPQPPRPGDLPDPARRDDGRRRRRLAGGPGVRLPGRGGCVRPPVRPRRGLSIWEKPIFSRLVSFDHPEVIEEGMVFALETFWPASDGWSAARIEEQLIVTSDGCEVITRFPAEELLVTAGGHYTATGRLPGTRETESHRNQGGTLDWVVAGRAQRRCGIDARGRRACLPT